MSGLYNWSETEVLIIGGTGSLGKTILKKLVTHYRPRGIRVFSRDELKQSELQQEVKLYNHKEIPVAYLLGDVRDLQRLSMACSGVDLIINCAAMKRVSACEYNPIEAVKTNIDGAYNIIEAAFLKGVKKVLHVSTDKAVQPINLYGMTKGVAEKLFLHANNYRGRNNITRFSCVRYGNVLGSRGSIIPVFKKLLETQDWLPITNLKMTRFWITLNNVSQFIIDRSETMQGEEIFVPRMGCLSLVDLCNYLFPNIEQREVGIRKGEKVHECLISEEEAKFTTMYKGGFCIGNKEVANVKGAFVSNDSSSILTENDLRNMLGLPSSILD